MTPSTACFVVVFEFHLVLLRGWFSRSFPICTGEVKIILRCKSGCCQRANRLTLLHAGRHAVASQPIYRPRCFWFHQMCCKAEVSSSCFLLVDGLLSSEYKEALLGSELKVPQPWPEVWCWSCCSCRFPCSSLAAMPLLCRKMDVSCQMIW